MTGTFANTDIPKKWKVDVGTSSFGEVRI